MPKSLQYYLQTLSDASAKELWDWLDGWPVVAQDMIEVLVDTHPNIKEV